MKLAVVDPGGSPGGVSRLVQALLPAVRALRPNWNIVYFGSAAAMERENLREHCHSLDIEVRSLSSVKLSNLKLFNLADTGKFIGYLQQRYSKQISLLPVYFSGAVHTEIEKKVKGFDLAFFPWIYRFKSPNLECPMIGLIHDFNYKYYFCAKGFHRWTREYLNREIPHWLEKTVPVVSCQFMKEELAKFYPEQASRAKVVHLAPWSVPSLLEEGRAKEVVNQLGITKDYILYPLSTAGPHKNVGTLLAAFSSLRKQRRDILLILTGFETDLIRGKACLEGVELGRDNPDVIGLGYVSHEQMNALIQCARVVVNPSLYEAGNGPGLDAWVRGVPVAMSDIPSFAEQVRVFGVKAGMFNPRSSDDIADKLDRLLIDPIKTKEDAIFSQREISKFNWEWTAEKYITIFEQEVKGLYA